MPRIGQRVSGGQRISGDTKLTGWVTQVCTSSLHSWIVLPKRGETDSFKSRWAGPGSGRQAWDSLMKRVKIGQTGGRVNGSGGSTLWLCA